MQNPRRDAMADIRIQLTVQGSDYRVVNKLGFIPCNGFTYDTSTGGRTYPNIIVNRDIDGASTTLLQAANRGAVFSSATIDIVKLGLPDEDDGFLPMEWSNLTLIDGAFVSDLVTSKPGGSKTEVLVLSYKDLKFQNVHNANGQTTPPTGEMGWDVVTTTVGG
jgi:type VI protein secretion system component Hcp